MRFLTLLLLAAALLPAHDLYLKPAKSVVTPGEKVRVEYHSGDDFGRSTAPISLERLRDAKRISASGEAAFEGVRNEGKMTVATFTAPASGHFYLLSSTAPNFIEMAPDKFEEYLHHEVLDPIREWRKQHGESGSKGREIYSKYIKSLLVAGKGDGSFSKPAGMKFEFVPLDDPYATPVGGTLRVRLLLDGKASAGQPVESAWIGAGGKIHEGIIGKTAANGEVKVPITEAGFHKLHCIVMQRRQNRTEADWESFWTTLTFVIR